MKVAHIVTLVSPDGAYGGPVRVAQNQAKALMDAGHEVTIFAARRGYPEAPTKLGSVPLITFPGHNFVPRTGFAGISSPGLLLRMSRTLRSYDVVHVHLARDLVTMPAARLAVAMGVPLVVQTHGSVDRSQRALSIPLDAAFTRPVLRRASTAFYLTPREQQDLEEVGRGQARLRHLVNGVPRAELESLETQGKDVIFLGRLHEQKGAVLFARAALRLLDALPNVRFSLVGPDEGDGPLIAEILREGHAGDRILWEGALAPEHTLERLARASLLVLPSENDTFPMSVLEAASLGLPAVITDTCGLAERVREYGAGAVVPRSPDAVAAAISMMMLDDAARATAGSQAKAMAERYFGMGSVAETLLGSYSEAILGASRR